jgi:hypothetical protein
MAKLTVLERQWRELMLLCDVEAKYREGHHPKIRRLVSQRIEDLASEMGFAPRLIQTREFRALRRGERIVKIIKGE